MTTIIQGVHIWTTSFSAEPYKDRELSYRMMYTMAEISYSALASVFANCMTSVVVWEIETLFDEGLTLVGHVNSTCYNELTQNRFNRSNLAMVQSLGRHVSWCTCTFIALVFFMVILGLNCAESLLSSLPRDYICYSHSAKLQQLKAILKQNSCMRIYIVLSPTVGEGSTFL